MADSNNLGSLSLGGPIVFSGLAIAQDKLLKLMDNYMEFMVGMFNQVSENASIYGTTVLNQSKAEINQAESQADSDLFAGLSQSISAIVPGLCGVGGYLKTRSIGNDIDTLRADTQELRSAQNEISKVMNHPEATLAEFPSVGNSAGPERSFDPNSEPQTPAHAKRYLKQFEDEPHAMVRELSGKDRATGETKITPEQKEAARKRLKKSIAMVVKDGTVADQEFVTKASKALDNRLSQNEQRISALEAGRSSKMQAATTFGQAAGGLSGLGLTLARQDSTQEVGKYRSEVALSQAASGQSNSSQQATEKTASEAGKHADDIISALKQLQANNSSKA